MSCVTPNKNEVSSTPNRREHVKPSHCVDSVCPLILREDKRDGLKDGTDLVIGEEEGLQFLSIDVSGSDLLP